MPGKDPQLKRDRVANAKEWAEYGEGMTEDGEGRDGEMEEEWETAVRQRQR